MMQPWTGDLDGMIERRVIRVLTVPSKTTYFQDRGRQRGTTYDAFRLLEKDLNAQLEREKKLKHKHLTVRFIFIPVGRDELLPALTEGKGDIAAAGLTVTPERQKLVDFAAPIVDGRARSCPHRACVACGGHARRPRRRGGLRAQVLQLLREPGRPKPALRLREQSRR